MTTSILSAMDSMEKSSILTQYRLVFSAFRFEFVSYNLNFTFTVKGCHLFNQLLTTLVISLSNISQNTSVK